MSKFLMLIVLFWLATPANANPVSIKPVIEEATLENLIVSWKYDFSNDSLFLVSPTHTLLLPESLKGTLKNQN